MAKRKRIPMEKGTLVGTGGFGVDSRRAAKVLRARQLAEATETAPLLWIRVAALSGASRAVLLVQSGRFEARFDGRPLPRSLLGRPYDAYLGTFGQGEPVMRAFGLALLHLSHPGVTVEVTSGPPQERSVIYLEGPGARPPEPVEDGGDETVIRAFWYGSQTPRAGHPETWDLFGLSDRLRSCPFPVTLAGGIKTEVILPWGRRHGREAWEGSPGGARAGMRVIPEPGAPARVSLCVDGVAADSVSLTGFPLPVEGWVDDARLSLSASLDAVVEDEARERAAGAARAGATAAFEAAARRHAVRMGLIASIFRRRPKLWERFAARLGEHDGGKTIRERAAASRLLWRGPKGDLALLDDMAVWLAAWRRAYQLVRRAKSGGRKEWRALLDAMPLGFEDDFSLVTGKEQYP